VQELRHQNDSLNSDILMLMEEKGNMMSDLRVLQQQMQEVSYPSFVITDFSNSELLGFHTGKETRFSSWLMKVQWYSQVRRKLKSPKF
jgi:hypothetical protein